MTTSHFPAGEPFERRVVGLLAPRDNRFDAAATRTHESSVDVLSELGILQPQEVADLLKLRYSTVLDLSRRGVLPAFKIGKHWRYRLSDLEQWMADRLGAG